MSKRALNTSPAPSAAAPSPKRAKLEIAAEPAAGPSWWRFSPKNKKRKRPPPPEYGSHDHILATEVERLLEAEGTKLGPDDGWTAPEGIEFGTELEVTVKEISSTGDSLSLLPKPYPPWVLVTPFALPQERIVVRVGRYLRAGHSSATLVRVIEPNSELRDDSRARCRYFGKCAGCQYQMLSYDTQLDLKRDVVARAYKHFSNLPATVVPKVLPTIASPLTYGYRTKITPHFDAPPGAGGRHGKKKGAPQPAQVKGTTGLGANGDWELRIGFDEKGSRRVMDIEECPIATDVINVGLKEARKTVQDTIQTYTRGATLLLRDSVLVGVAPSKEKLDISEPKNLAPNEREAVAVEEIGVDDGRGGAVDTSAPRLSPVDIQTEPGAQVIAIAANRDEESSARDIASVQEAAPTSDDVSGATVEDVAPQFPARDGDAGRPGSFDPVSATAMTDAIPASTEKVTDMSTQSNNEEHVCITSPQATIHERVGPYLFSSPASAFFQNNNSVLVPLTDYVKEAIQQATVGQGEEHPTHLVDAYCGSGLFSLMLSSPFEKIAGIDISLHSVASAMKNLELNALPKEKFAFQTGTASDIFSSVADFPPSNTAVIIDPPRKGCDEPFLKQLLSFRPKVVVYVSCNVHTQARDVGWLLKTQEDEGRTDENGAYGIVSIRGFDLFPQTSHVESVAVLVRR